MLVAFAVLAVLLPQEPDEALADRFVGGDLERQLAAIVPGADDRAWQAVPWASEFRRALVAGAEQDKPVLLWAMNGHPLGQT